jgi:hypothetical protein
MQCNKCGAPINPGDPYCRTCGAPISNTQGQYSPYGQPQQPVYPQTHNTTYEDPRFDYTPLGMWAYFGYAILFSIPLVGFIMELIFSFGGTNNIHLRNMSRGFLCLAILTGILGFFFLFGSVNLLRLIQNNIVY